MAIYLHTPMSSPGSKGSAQAKRAFRPGRLFSHLVADSEDELRAFARKIGLSASWIQHPGTGEVHFDVVGVWLEKLQKHPDVVQIGLRKFVEVLRINRAKLAPLE